VPDVIYRRVARLLIECRGAYAAELARKRAVSSRLMGDDVAFRTFMSVREEAELLLKDGNSRTVPEDLDNGGADPNALAPVLALRGA
jgi:hypothetical protein